MSSASRRRRRAPKRKSHSREHAAEETLLRSEGGLAVCRSSIGANCTPAFNPGLGRALSLFTFPRPSTEKYRRFVTNNLYRGCGSANNGIVRTDPKQSGTNSAFPLPDPLGVSKPLIPQYFSHKPC